MTPNTSPEPAATATGYLRILAGRWRVLVATLAVALVAAGVALASSPTRYTSTSEILVSPISSSDDSFVGVSVLRDSTISPTTGVLTIARLVTAPQTVALVRQRLRSPLSPTALADKVTVSPLAQTSIVSISASDSTPGGAARLANGFASATIARRTAQFQQTLRAAIAGLEHQGAKFRSGSAAPLRAALQARLAVLTPLVGTSDPTLQVLNSAVAGSPSGPSPLLVLAAAAVAGILLGAGFAFLRDSTDPRLLRLDQVLRELPRERLARGLAVIRGDAARGAGQPAALRQLVARVLGPASPRSIAVVGAGEGASSTAAALAIARSAARLGRRTVLVSGNGAPMDGAPQPNLTLASEPPGAHEDGVVVLDCASPALDPNAAARAAAADAVVASVELGRTSKEDLRSLRDVLADAGVAPAGMVVLTSPAGSEAEAGEAGARRVGGLQAGPVLRRAGSLGGSVTSFVASKALGADRPGGNVH